MFDGDGLEVAASAAKPKVDDVYVISSQTDQASTWDQFKSMSEDFVGNMSSDMSSSFQDASFTVFRYSKDLKGDYLPVKELQVKVKNLTEAEAEAWGLLMKLPFGKLGSLVTTLGEVLFDLNVNREVDPNESSFRKFEKSKPKTSEEEAVSFAESLFYLCAVARSDFGMNMSAQQAQAVAKSVAWLVSSLTSEELGHGPSSVFVGEMLRDHCNLTHLHFPEASEDLSMPLPTLELSVVTTNNKVIHASDNAFMSHFTKVGKHSVLKVKGVFSNHLYMPVKGRILIPDLDVMCASKAISMASILGQANVRLSHGEISVHIPIYCEKTDKVC